MEDPKRFLARSFELRKFSKACNVHGCIRLPTKEAIITELNPKTLKQRDVISLYFCTEHYNKEMRKFLREFSGVCKGKIIDKKVFEIGYVTY